MGLSEEIILSCPSQLVEDSLPFKVVIIDRTVVGLNSQTKAPNAESKRGGPLLGKDSVVLCNPENPTYQGLHMCQRDEPKDEM